MPLVPDKIDHIQTLVTTIANNLEAFMATAATPATLDTRQNLAQKILDTHAQAELHLLSYINSHGFTAQNRRLLEKFNTMRTNFLHLYNDCVAERLAITA